MDDPSEKKIKLVVVGDVGGAFEKLAKKLKSFNKSAAGPFDMAFCVGNFFSKPTGEQLNAQQSIAEQQLAPILEGTVSFPIPVYFIAGPDEDSFLPGTRERLAPNLNYLGRQGIATLRNGLTVAYFSGQFGGAAPGAPASATKPSFFHRDVDSLVATWSSDYNRGVDVLLTNEWSAGLLNHVTPDAWPRSPSGRPFQHVGSTRVADIAKTLKPRYHFAGLENQFWSRRPYKNRESATDFGASHVTRFVALGAAFHASKQRFVYAINMTPVAHMDQPTLLTQPDDTTDSPFVGPLPVADGSSGSSGASPGAMPSSFGGGVKRKMGGFVAAGGGSSTNKKNPNAIPVGVHAAAGAQSLLKLPSLPVSQPPPPPEGGFSRWAGGDAGNGGGRRRQQRDRGAPPGPCWFCLSSPDVEKHMVVSVGKYFYLALAKGGLVPEHLLIIPVKHVLATTELEQLVHRDDADPAERDEARAALSELEGWRQALAQFFDSSGQNKDVVFFERHIITGKPMHMHIQVVPVPRGGPLPASVQEAMASSPAPDDTPSGAGDETDQQSRWSLFKQAWLALGSKTGVDFRSMDPDESLLQATADKAFFSVVLPSKERLLHLIDGTRRFNFQFGRSICSQLLDMPDRVDWRKCALSKEEETSVAKSLRKEFKPFDNFLRPSKKQKTEAD